MNTFELNVVRQTYTAKSTIGSLYTDAILQEDGLASGGNFYCYTLEDVARLVKIKNETAIFPGRYEIEIRYSNKFGRFMPFLIGVDQFDAIEIHWGNKAANTDGCILVGRGKSTDWISESQAAFDPLFQMISNAIHSGRRTFITVHNTQEPRP